MPAVSNKCTNNNKLKTSFSNNCIKTISNYVSNSHLSPSISKPKQSTNTKCPHVILIGNVFTEDLDPHYRRQIQIKKQRLIEDKDLQHEEEDNDLKCDECEQRRNLWLCLRETCLFVGCGCGKDDNSNKHSTLHAQQSYHPLSINLTTKAVWCELCNNKIDLEHNNPPYYLKSKQSLQINDQNGTQEDNLDDFDLIDYLDQETASSSRRKLFNSLQTKSNNSYSSYLFNFDYTSNLNGSNEEEEEEAQTDETDSDLNDYFSDHLKTAKNIKKKRKKKQFQPGGKLGLENLGNTCYTNAALQALSNCYAFTSYFLECAPYLQARLVNQAAYLDLNSLNKQISLPCLAMSYMKLMKELWKQPKKNSTSFSPNELVQVIKYINPMFRGYMQHDSQEFLIYLMDQLHEELKRPIIEQKVAVEQVEEETINGFKQETSSKDVDSGIFRLSINTNNNNNLNDDTESVDSFETCDSAVISTDRTDLDDDETFKNTSSSIVSISPELKRLKLKQSSSSSSIQAVEKQQLSNKPLRVGYSSIVSDLFEGKLMGQVQCLECLNVSTTTESFLHLSLPIPTKEYLQALHAKLLNNKNNLMLTNGSNDETQLNQGWIGWMMDLMKGFIWSQTIKLTECLTAFFSEDDLKGDNMYSCEKCKKLTNGVKYSKLLELPETLIIHLKRFRHDSMFSTGKISSYVSFPLDDLEMKPFVHKDCKNEVTQYDLSSIICHYGSSNGGHYTSYARNHFDEEWYEFDDSYCRKVDSLTVQNIQAYVLFYKKKSNKIDTVREQLRTMIISRTSSTANQSLLKPFYISKQWLQKLKYFSEPGPIDNTDFLCRHNLVRPILWSQIDNLAVVCSADTWFFLIKQFGLKKQNEDDDDHNICNHLYPCAKCQLEDEQMKQRQIFEKDEFIRLNDKSRVCFQQTLNNSTSININTNQHKLYAISATWFKLWEQFVQFKHCPQEHQIPGPINNLSICNQQLLKQQQNNPIVYQLNKNSNYYKLPEETWHFLFKIYGGGPELVASNNTLNGSKPSSPKTNSLQNPLKVEETQL